MNTKTVAVALAAMLTVVGGAAAVSSTGTSSARRAPRPTRTAKPRTDASP